MAPWWRSLTEIMKIEKVDVWPLSFIKIFLINGNKINIAPLDDQEVFLQMVKR